MQTMTLGQAIRLIREHATESPETFGEALWLTEAQLLALEEGTLRVSRTRLAAILEVIRTCYGYDPELLLALDLVERGPRKGLNHLTAHRAILGLSVG